MIMKAIPVTKAVGMVLGHDVTKIVPRQQKGPAFKRGHIIREDEIDKFLEIGKEHVYVIDLSSQSLKYLFADTNTNFCSTQVDQQLFGNGNG